MRFMRRWAPFAPILRPKRVMTGRQRNDPSEIPLCKRLPQYRRRGKRLAGCTDCAHSRTERIGQDEPSLGHRTGTDGRRSEEHTSELQSLMRLSYAVLRLKKKHRR